jgi:hypothetical protein
MVLGGCATSKDELLPHGDHTMLDVWKQETAAAPADRRRGNCSMRARACAGR